MTPPTVSNVQRRALASIWGEIRQSFALHAFKMNAMFLPTSSTSLACCGESTAGTMDGCSS